MEAKRRADSDVSFAFERRCDGHAQELARRGAGAVATKRSGRSEDGSGGPPSGKAARAVVKAGWVDEPLGVPRVRPGGGPKRAGRAPDDDGRPAPLRQGVHPSRNARLK